MLEAVTRNGNHGSNLAHFIGVNDGVSNELSAALFSSSFGGFSDLVQRFIGKYFWPQKKAACSRIIRIAWQGNVCPCCSV